MRNKEKDKRDNDKRMKRYKKECGTTHPRNYKKEYVCKTCGSKYYPFNTLSKYCSPKCAGKAHLKRQKKLCPTCGHEYVTHNGKSQTKYCSPKCYYKAIMKKPKKCPVCKKDFLKNNRIYCSRKCSQEGVRGRQTNTVKNSKLDPIWAEAIKLKAGNKCEYCGSTNRLNSHHIFSRSNYSVRWDIDNGTCLCVTHHVFGTISAHKAPLEFAEWLKETRGKEWYEQLRFKAKNVAKKTTKEERKQIKERLLKFIVNNTKN